MKYKKKQFAFLQGSATSSSDLNFKINGQNIEQISGVVLDSHL